MKRVLLFLCLSALALVPAACQGTEATANVQGFRSEGLETYRGEGFSFQYPAEARVGSAGTGEVRIVGPQISVRPGDSDWTYDGSAYELIVQTYDNPDGLDSESWARSYILDSWRQAQERGDPLMGPPVSEDGEIVEERVGGSLVASQPAFRADFFAGDSYRRTFFVASGHQVVALSFYDYPLANQPLAVMQKDVYALIVGTIRFE